jgi:hypothetical protein
MMRELRATSRMLVQHRDLWQRWSPATAQSALQEMRALADFVDELRALTLQPSVRPFDLESN